jgi:antibiotic biosynthesis monooxygenase (ABM) superfamily enzyme
MGQATGVTVFHPVADSAGFQTWLSQLDAAARSAPGCVSAGASMHDDPLLDRAHSATFDTEDWLHRWLDSPERLNVLEGGQVLGYWRQTSDLVITAAGAPAGVGEFRHNVKAGSEGEFVSAQVRLARAGSGFPGYEGTALLASGIADERISLVRFRTGGQLSAWLRSPERSAALGDLRSSLSKDFAVVANTTTPFATTVRTENGQTLMTPNWKSVMMVLLVLYPTVMILSRFFGPVLDGMGAAPWLALWISQILSVSLMQWWLMPVATRPFTRWLDPVDGAGWRISLAGAAVVVVCYAVTLMAFANVKWLQFWDFAS